MGTGGFADLALAMGRLYIAFPGISSNVVKEVVKAAHREIVLATPVDTGLARSNWIVSVGAPVATVIKPYAPGSSLGTSESANADAAIAAGESALDAAPASATVFVIQNNVPYIGLLNAGSSQQAPAMFVELGIAAGLGKLSNVNIKLVI